MRLETVPRAGGPCTRFFTRQRVPAKQTRSQDRPSSICTSDLLCRWAAHRAFIPPLIRSRFRQLTRMTAAAHKTSNPPPSPLPHSMTARLRPRVTPAGRSVRNPTAAPRWVPKRGRVLRSVLRAVFSCFKLQRPRRPSPAVSPPPPTF